MKEIKSKILKSIVPEVVLYPITKEAKDSLISSQLQNDIIPINTYPFRIGREARMSETEKGFFVKLRLFSSAEPNNDVYLIDNGEYLQISREHFQITKNENTYTLIDRGSTNGIVINDIHYGGDHEAFEKELSDEDIIKIGSNSSLYTFQFLKLEVGN